SVDLSAELSHRIELVDGLLYVAFGNDLVAYDYAAMEEVERLSFPANIMRLRRDGTNLFLLTGDFPARTLRAVDISGLSMVERGSLILARAAWNLVVADGTAWILLTPVMGRSWPSMSVPLMLFG